LDYLLCPVGGGGLLSGTALATHYFSPQTLVMAGEPEGAADAILSFQKGEITKAPYVDTIADGLLTTLGDKTFAIIQKHVTDIVTVSDQDIIDTMKLVWERMKIVVEPSGVVAVAAVLKYKGNFTGKNIGVIITGGNVDLGRLPF
jgi:threonine dehydratase